MLKLFIIFIFFTITHNQLFAQEYKGYLVLKNGRVVSIPSNKIKKDLTITAELLDFKNDKKTINISEISRVIKIRDKNEAIIFLKNKKQYRIKYHDEYLFREKDSSPYTKDKIANNMINEIIFN